VLEHSSLGLLGKSSKGLARAIDCLFAADSAGEELTHGTSSAFAAREPPERELLRIDLAVFVEVNVVDHVVKLGDTQV